MELQTFDPTAEGAEDVAWAAGLNLNDPPENFDAIMPDGRTMRQISTETYRTYFEARKSKGLEVFPTVAAKSARKQAGEYQKAFGGLDKLKENLTPEQWQQLELGGQGEVDPQEYYARAINGNFLGSMMGREIPPESLSSVRDAYARDVLKLQGPVTDKAVYQAIGARHVEDQTDSATFSAGLTEGITKRLATVGKVDTTPPTADQIKGFVRPSPASLEYKPSIEDRDALLEKISERNRPAFRQKWNKTNREMSRLFQKHAPLVDRIVGTMSKIQEADSPERMILDNVNRWAEDLPRNPYDRDVFLAMLGNALGNLPPDTRDGLLRVATAAKRGAIQGGEATAQAMQAQARQAIRALPYGDPNVFEVTSDAKTDEIQRRRLLLDTIRGNGMKLSNVADNLFLQSGVAAAGSAWMFPAAFTPVGQLAIAETMTGDSFQKASIENPDVAEGLRINAATGSGMAQAVIETFSNTTGVKLMMGKLPRFAGVLNKFGIASPAGRAALGFAAGAAATTGMEYSEEVAQGATDMALQALAADLGGQKPEVDWGGYFGQWLDPRQAGPEQRETLLAVSAFGMIAGAGASYNHFRYGSALARSKTFLRAHGFTEAEVRDISNTVDLDEAAEKTRAAFDQAQERAKTATPEETSRLADLRAEAIAVLKASNEAYARAGMPRVEKEHNDFTETDQWVFIDTTTGERKPFETEEEALGAWQDWNAEQSAENLSSIQEAGQAGFIDHLTGEGSLTEDVNVEVSTKTVTPATERAGAEADVKEAETAARKAITPAHERAAREKLESAKGRLANLTARVEVFLLERGIDPTNAVAVGRALESVTIKAKSFATMLQGQVVGYTVQLFNGHSIQDIAEDFAETAMKIAVDSGFADPEILLDDIRRYEQASGHRVIAPDYEYDPANTLPLVEGFSKLARGMLMGNVRSGLLPPEVSAWLELQASLTAGAVEVAKAAGKGIEFAMDVQTAGELRAAIKAGQVPPRLERLLRDSLGLDPAETQRRLEKKMEEQLAAEAMEGFPEISDVMKGRLPHPETLRENNHPLYGEVRRIWESLKKPTKRRTKAGKTVDRVNEANAFFLPVGEMEDLDHVRQAVNERGFAFDSITDMLDALDVSISYGKPFYGTQSTADESWAMGDAKPFFSSTAVQALRHDKTAWLDAGATPAGADEIVSNYYKTASFAGIPKDAVLVAMPSTSGRNVLPFFLAKRLSKDFGNPMEERPAGTAIAAGEAKNKRTFFDKEADPVGFVPVPEVVADLQGKRVFLAEDVHNTGESWIAFARMLQENGVEVVGVAALVSTEQRMTSPRDIERLSEKVADHLGKPIDEVLPAMQSLFNGTFKQLFNKAEADITRSGDKAAKLFEIAVSGRRAGAYSNPLRSGQESGSGSGGVLGEQGLNLFGESWAMSATQLHESLLDKIGEEALRLEQPKASYEDKNQLLLSFAQSIVGSSEDSHASVTSDNAEGGTLRGRIGSGNLSIIRQRLARDLQTDLQVRFVGDTVSSPESLAAKAQALRNPRFETFYLLAAKPRTKRHKGGEGYQILDAMALTSRVPTAAVVFEGKVTFQEGIEQHLAFLQAAKATHYFLIHNHPSGDPSPSAADLSITRNHAAAMKTHGMALVDHIVINHKKFVAINADGVTKEETIPAWLARESEAEADPYAWPSRLIDGVKDVGERGFTPNEIASVAREIEADRETPNHILGFVTSARGRIVATFSGLKKDILAITTKQLQEYSLSQGGAFMFLHAKAANRAEAVGILNEFKEMNASGRLMDLVVDYANDQGTLSVTSGFSEPQVMFLHAPAFYGGESKLVGERVQESWAMGPEYGILHRPNEEGPRAFDLSENDLMPPDVYEHPEWYSAMSQKIINQTMRQLRAVKGKAEAVLTIYRAGPKGEMNSGDWVSLSKEYARTHADAQDPEGYKVWESKVKAQDVRWDMNDLAEFGYFGETTDAVQSNVSFAIGSFRRIPDESWAMSPAQMDPEYLAAVEAGDMEKAGGWVKKAWMTHDNLWQYEWLLDQSKEAGYVSPDEHASQNSDGFKSLCVQWRDDHPRPRITDSKSGNPLGDQDGTTPGLSIVERDEAGEIISLAKRFPLPETVQGGETYAMSGPSLMRLEEAIAKRMTRGPDERAEYFQRLRNRLAATVLMMREAKRNLVTDDQTDVERERARIRDAVAEASAIIKALPMEARGRVPFNVNDILDADTERGQINGLIRLIDKADEALEVVLLKEYRDAFETLLDLAKPDLRQNKQVRGRLTPETQRMVGKILSVVTLTPAELAIAIPAKQAEIDALENNPPTAPEEIAAAQKRLIELYEEQVILETFGAFGSLDAAATAHAYEQLQSIYITGRTTRKILDEAKKAEIAEAKKELLSTLPEIDQAKHAERTAEKGFLDAAEAFRLGMSSFHQVMEWLFPRSTVARDFQEQVRKADRSFVRAKLAAKDRFDQFTFGAWNLSGVSRARKRNRILAALSTLRTDWGITLQEGVTFANEKLTEEQAAAILDGTMKVGWETDAIAMTSLRQALADFRMQRLKAQNEDKKFTSTVIRFQRLTHRGKPGAFIASDLQALYFLQLYAQEQYRPALDKHGFTAEVIEAIEKKIDSKAIDLGDFLRDEYDAEWGRLNPVYRAIYGLDMPKIRNYAPGMFEHLDAKSGGDSTIDPYGNASTVNAMSAGFTKARQHHMARPKLTNAMAGFWGHLEATEYFIAYAEIMRDARQIFRNPEVRRRIEGSYGTRVASLWSQWLDALEVDGNFRAVEMMALAEMTHRALATQSAVGLAFNVGVLFKQASAAFGVLLEMPTGQAVKGFARALANPASLKAVWGSEAVQQRILAGMSPEDRKLIDASSASPSLIMELLQIGRLPIAFADAAFTTLGASIAYNYHLTEALKAGVAPAQAEASALAAASRVIERTAQPATSQDKSMAELTAKGFGKFLFLFKSDPRQKLAIVAAAVQEFRRGTPGSGKKLVRKALWGWVMYGLMAEVMTDIWQSISRDDDDEERWSWKDYAAAMISGPISAIPLYGQAFDYLVRTGLGGKAFQNAANPIEAGAGRLVPATMKLIDSIAEDDKDVTAADILTASQQWAAATALAVGGIDPRFAILPASLRLARDAWGTASNLAGMMMEPTADDAALEIVRELAEGQQTTRDGKSEVLNQLAKDLGKLPPADRTARLAKLDRETRSSVIRRLRKAQMTSSEMALDKLTAPNRKLAVARITAEMTPAEKEAYAERLRSLGLD